MAVREILLRLRAIDPALLDQAEQISAATATSLVHILVRYRVMGAKQLARLLSRACHVDFIDVAALDVHRRLLDVVPRDAAERLRILPVAIKKTDVGERLYLAMTDPSDEGVVGVVEKATGRVVEVMCCDEESLGAAIERLYSSDAPVIVGVAAGVEFLTDSTSEAMQIAERARDRGLAMLESDLDLPEVPGLADEDFDYAEDPTLEMVRLNESAAALTAALSEVTSEMVRTNRTSMPTMQQVWGEHSAPGVPDVPEHVDVDSGNVGFAGAGSAPRVTVAVAPSMDPQQRALLLTELLDLLGTIDLEDDAVSACRSARHSRALVLLAPRPHSGLLRALLDVEELASRPRVIVLGGDPALHMLAVVDHHADLPAGSVRAIAVAVVAALRQAGIQL